MVRDYWFYESCEDDPFAVHIWVVTDKAKGTYIDMAYYAEYIPAKTCIDLGVPASFNALHTAIESFLRGHGKTPLSPPDLEALQELWGIVVKDASS